jgi:hypothetical protein
MMVPHVQLVAHFAGPDGKRCKSLPIVAIDPNKAMYVLWQNKLVPAVTIKDPMMKFDRIDYEVEQSTPSIKRTKGSVQE